MKQNYHKPKIEIILIETENILAQSNGPNGYSFSLGEENEEEVTGYGRAKKINW